MSYSERRKRYTCCGTNYHTITVTWEGEAQKHSQRLWGCGQKQGDTRVQCNKHNARVKSVGNTHTPVDV